jgi:hypothetical protein
MHLTPLLTIIPLQALPIVLLKTVDVETGVDMKPAGAKGELCVKVHTLLLASATSCCY